MIVACSKIVLVDDRRMIKNKRKERKRKLAPFLVILRLLNYEAALSTAWVSSR